MANSLYDPVVAGSKITHEWMNNIEGAVLSQGVFDYVIKQRSGTWYLYDSEGVELDTSANARELIQTVHDDYWTTTSGDVVSGRDSLLVIGDFTIDATITILRSNWTLTILGEVTLNADGFTIGDADNFCKYWSLTVEQIKGPDDASRAYNGLNLVHVGTGEFRARLMVWLQYAVNWVPASGCPANDVDVFVGQIYSCTEGFRMNAATGTWVEGNNAKCNIFFTIDANNRGVHILGAGTNRGNMVIGDFDSYGAAGAYDIYDEKGNNVFIIGWGYNISDYSIPNNSVLIMGKPYGFILKDQTTGNLRRLKLDNGVLSDEAVS